MSNVKKESNMLHCNKKRWNKASASFGVVTSKLNIHKYINKFVSITKKIEIPSTPNFKEKEYVGIKFKVYVDWKPPLISSMEDHNNKDNKKEIKEE